MLLKNASYLDENLSIVQGDLLIKDGKIIINVATNSFGTSRDIKRGDYALFIYRSTGGEKQETYTIKRGDTLSEIAATFPNVSVNDILKANPLLQPKQLPIGTTIVIPG